MRNHLLVAVLVLCTLAGAAVSAQEVKVHHGFLFFAGEKYTMDEKTYGIYEDGHLFTDVIKENPEAMDAFKSYKTWHVMSLVATGVGLAAFVFGGVYYLFEKDMSEAMGSSAGVIGFATGGGLIVLGMVCEFVAWGNITDAATTYNKKLIDEGPGGSASLEPSLVPQVAIGPGALALTWRF